MARRATFAAVLNAFLAEIMKDRAMRIKQLLLDVFNAVRTDRANSTHVQKPILLVLEAVASQRHRLLGFRRHAIAHDQARPVSSDWFDFVKFIAGVSQRRRSD